MRRRSFLAAIGGAVGAMLAAPAALLWGRKQSRADWLRENGIPTRNGGMMLGNSEEMFWAEQAADGSITYTRIG